jgi:flagellar assembly protein FliH
MVLRLIKKDDQSAARVKAFSFLENPADIGVPAVEEPLWMRGAVPGLDGMPPAAARPRQQQPDPAHIEKQAYESGFRQGEKAGMEIAEKKIEALTKRYAESIAELGKLKSGLYQRAERDVVRLALEVARKIVHREIMADREIVQTLVRVALSHVVVKSAVTVRLHPTDYSQILQHRAELNQSSDEDKEIVLVADKSIERGGCLVQTECGDVDARIEEEFREVERSFFEDEERGNP